MNKRFEKWDNVKGMLIILVVVGHYMYYFQDDTWNMSRIYYGIHLFHMPLFVFISGLFLRRTVETALRQGDGALMILDKATGELRN